MNGKELLLSILLSPLVLVGIVLYPFIILKRVLSGEVID